jgi:hypothetical protein
VLLIEPHHLLRPTETQVEIDTLNDEGEQYARQQGAIPPGTG